MMRMSLPQKAILFAGLLCILLAHSGFATVLSLPLNNNTVSQELQSIADGKAWGSPLV